MNLEILVLVPNPLFKNGIFPTLSTGYPSFVGRWGRASYFLAQLGAVLPFIVLMAYVFIDSNTRKHTDSPPGSGLIMLLGYTIPILLALLISTILWAVAFWATVGRLKDIDASPYYSILFFVPGLGLLLMLYLMFAPGTKDPHRYGERHVQSKSESKRDLFCNEGHPGICLDFDPDSDEEVIKALRKNELYRSIRPPKSTDLLAVRIGFDPRNSRFYISRSLFGGKGEPKPEIDFYFNYGAMCDAIWAFTGLDIHSFVTECKVDSPISKR